MFKTFKGEFLTISFDIRSSPSDLQVLSFEELFGRKNGV